MFKAFRRVSRSFGSIASSALEVDWISLRSSLLNRENTMLGFLATSKLPWEALVPFN